MIIADLHIHGKYSRATSYHLSIDNLEKYAKIKGVNLLGTGDYTHPKWIQHLKENLKDDGTGILKTKNNFPFILQTEISLMYSQGGKGRRVHNIVLAPNLEVVNQITEYLKKKGRVDYDGRPIFKITCVEFVEDLRKISNDIEVIPAHIWTPWFGLLGSKSGFDSFEEAFQDQVKYIHALETGLSSDPEMNWRLSKLDRYSIVSFSDLHSFWPWRIGRESTVFDINLTYKNLIKAIREKDVKSTIEVDPSYGKYHFDGHRNCNIVMDPKEALKHNNICPKCGKLLTLGVLHRVEELADRKLGFKSKNAKPFKRLIPLSELISNVHGYGIATKSTWDVYNKLINRFKNEFNILLNVKEEELKEIVSDKLAKVIIMNREEKVKVDPGYDGVYGKLVLENNLKIRKQKSLTDY